MTAPDVVEEEVPPAPAALMGSMRAVGYSIETAIADLIDNSISAGARKIGVCFKWDGPNSWVVVKDDGRGMSEGELREAMRLGSRNPNEERAHDDLGRFGLGLKSAGWSQARSLSVITQQPDGKSAVSRRWDLDHVTKKGKWILLLDLSTVGARCKKELESEGSGTVVLLERVDRLVGPESADNMAAQSRFLRTVDQTQKHISMVFHRFMSGPKAVAITVNGQKVAPWDPFLETHSATQHLEEETFSTGAGQVKVAPFVLPHASKLTAEDHAAATGPQGWNSQQGFYVYRAKRLLVAGGWLGLKNMQKDEHLKLARIRIDIDNAQDELWQIDVRKSAARVPGQLQDEFHRIATVTRGKARDAYAFRGKIVARTAGRDDGLSFVWETRTLRGGIKRFTVNRTHPVISSASAEPDDARSAVEVVLRLVEENLPIAAIIVEAREHEGTEEEAPFSGLEAEVTEMMRNAYIGMTAAGMAGDTAFAVLSRAEPFASFPELVQALTEEVRDASQ